MEQAENLKKMYRYIEVYIYIYLYVSNHISIYILI